MTLASRSDGDRLREPDLAEAMIPPRPGQIPLDLGHSPSHSEADFMVFEGNRLAFEHILAFPAWPGPFTLVVGPAKAGKSHLGRIWMERTGAWQPDVDELQGLAAGGGAEPLLIEDVDRRGYDERALFHLLNQSMRDRRALLMTAREPIASWPYRTDDVRSRVRLAQGFALDPPDDTLLSQIFVKLFGDRQVSVDPRLIAYMVTRMERSPAEAVALVALVDHLALSKGKPITRGIVAEALELRRVGRTGSGKDSEEDIENG